jgi:hypothetical protein
MDYVSVITITKRNNINKIIINYKKQSYINKELIILINTIEINKNNVKEMLDKHNIINYQLYQNNENITLGECYNYCITKMNGNYFCKMDDDDFYDIHYITNQLYILKKMNIDIIGKSYFYVYDNYNKILYSKYIKSIILGPTMIIKKEVFNKVLFDKLNKGEDTQFLRKALKHGYKIRSSQINDFVYIRYTNNNNHHTYNVNIKEILGNQYNIIENNMLKNKLNEFVLI